MPEFGNVILSRREGEGFWIGNARVEVHEVRGGKVRVRITADKRVAVRRDEHVAPDGVDDYRQAPQWFQLQLEMRELWVDVGGARCELADLAQDVETVLASKTPRKARVVDALTGDVVYPVGGQS